MQNPYDLATADLAKAQIPIETLSRMLVPIAQAGGAYDPNVGQLLAAIALNQQRANTRYRVYPYSVANGFSQQILGENTKRNALLISVVAGSAYTLFEIGSPTATPLDATTLTRSLILTATSGGFEFYIPPINAITITAGGGDVSGVIFEGVPQ